MIFDYMSGLELTVGNGILNSKNTLQILPKLINFNAFSLAIGKGGSKSVVWFSFKYPSDTEMEIICSTIIGKANNYWNCTYN